ncbi:uncharacterized protein LOC110717109 [Chenopodium quinoa]|uniref:uncharacterized protein LOC110717109 n=1 Tax=Chenopodium quinoa TaxID=63459 RepID=UPI000B771C90|nr:uncharacterized protein LOC110717109 [Chenopodium quinoa]
MASISYARLRNPVICFFKPRGGLQPEIDFNNTIYLCPAANSPHSPYVSKEVLSNYILNPHMSSYTHRRLKMRLPNVEGAPVPAHLPNIGNCHALPKSMKRQLEWYLKNHHGVPFHLLHLLDPVHVLDFAAPIFQLQFDRLYLCMATYTDALQIVEAPMHSSALGLRVFCNWISAPSSGSPYHTVMVDPIGGPLFVPGLNPLNPNTRIAVWNIKGITRPSFLSNFALLSQIHNSSIILLLEIRHSGENVATMINHLQGRYHLYATPVSSFDGGCALMWNPDVVEIQQRPTFVRAAMVNVFIQGVPSFLSQAP